MSAAGTAVRGAPGRIYSIYMSRLGSDGMKT